MAHTYETQFWAVTLPDEWKVVSSHDWLITIFRPDGVGMLTVITSEPKQPQASYPSSKWETSERSDSKNFRKTWRISFRLRRLVVEYACAPANAHVEIQEVDEIVATFTPKF